MTTFVLFFLFFFGVNGQFQDVNNPLHSELEISNLELQDDCQFLANAQKSSLLTNTYSNKIKALEAHGHLLKTQSKNLRIYETEVPSEILRNWTFIVKPGDALLDDKDWSTLVTYNSDIYDLMHTYKVHCKNEQNCVFVKRGYEDLLETSKNKSLLKQGWSAWQTVLSTRRNGFSDVLSLVNKASLLNGFEDPKSYWEGLTDLEGAYTVAENFWNQIQPLYLKLQNFVKIRLFRYYNLTNTESEIPVYLLGSNFGNDWSYLADIVLPHPQIYFLAKSYLSKMHIRDIYRLSEEITQDLSLGSLGQKFWDNSQFNATFCENHVVSFCGEAHSELFTCSKTSWVAYLDSFETAINVGLKKVDFFELPRLNLRYSALDDAIVGLGSISAIKTLRSKGVWDYRMFMSDENGPNENEMTELLLIALRVLPKLPYYLAADKWRLELLQNGGKMVDSWWKYRKEYQGVEGVSNNETDFLGDEFVTSNKPYLSKFLGTVLQFQLLDYYSRDWQYTNKTIAINFGKDENFQSTLHERLSSDWPSLISKYYAFYELSADPLLDYFAPLNDYLDSAPLEQVYVSTTSSTTAKPKPSQKTNIEPKMLGKIQTEGPDQVQNDAEPPETPQHILDDQGHEAGENHAMESISMFIGLGLLVAVAGLITLVIVKKRLQRKRTNNRRFEA